MERAGSELYYPRDGRVSVLLTPTQGVRGVLVGTTEKKTRVVSATAGYGIIALPVPARRESFIPFQGHDVSSPHQTAGLRKCADQREGPASVGFRDANDASHPKSSPLPRERKAKKVSRSSLRPALDGKRKCLAKGVGFLASSPFVFVRLRNGQRSKCRIRRRQ